MASLILSISAALSSFPTRLTTIWSAKEFGIASSILFSTCLSLILQPSCHHSKRATHTAYCIWLHSSSSARIAALLFDPPAPPPPSPPDAGCTARRWLVIACKMSFTSTRALFTLNVHSFRLQSLMAAKSASPGTGGGILKLSLSGPDSAAEAPQLSVTLLALKSCCLLISPKNFVNGIEDSHFLSLYLKMPFTHL